MQKLDQFDNPLSQSRYVQKKRAEGKEEGKAEGNFEGKAEGRIEALQDLAIEFFDENFPAFPASNYWQNRLAALRFARYNGFNPSREAKERRSQSCLAQDKTYS